MKNNSTNLDRTMLSRHFGHKQLSLLSQCSQCCLVPHTTNLDRGKVILSGTPQALEAFDLTCDCWWVLLLLFLLFFFSIAFVFPHVFVKDRVQLRHFPQCVFPRLQTQCFSRQSVSWHSVKFFKIFCFPFTVMAEHFSSFLSM